MTITITSSFAHFGRSAFPLIRLPSVIRHRTALCADLPLPDCVRFNCCSPLASALAAAPSPIVSAACQCAACVHWLLLPDCVRFNCCSLIASASTAAPRLHPLQLLLPDCIRFNCCSPIVSASTAAPRLRQLRLLLPDCAYTCSPSWIQCSRTFFMEFEVQYE